MISFNPPQEVIKKAVLSGILNTQLQQNRLTTLMFNTRQTIQIFRICRQNLSALEEKNIVSASRKRCVFYYCPGMCAISSPIITTTTK